VRPSKNTKGRNTAARAMVVEITAKNNNDLISDAKIAKAATDRQAKADVQAIKDLQEKLSGTQAKLKTATDALATERVTCAGEKGELKGQIMTLGNDLKQLKLVEKKVVLLEDGNYELTLERDGQSTIIKEIQK
jgi:hypothetical protein